MERIERFKADRRIGSSTVLLGLLGDDRSGELGGFNRGKLGDEPARASSLGAAAGPRGYAITTRPLTSVAHELQHALGRRHAGRRLSCFNNDLDQVGELWPDPNDSGAMLGFGLDNRTGSGGIGPYELIASSPASPCSTS